MSSNLNEGSSSNPRLVFQHVTLGSFVAEGDIWTSNIALDSGSLELSLAGNESAPHESLVTAASALLARLSELKEAALDLLTSQDDTPDRRDFICQGMELLREESSDHFSLSFVFFGDLGGIWRVEFEDGEPLFLARDD